ncbi:MAG: protein kinase [Aridibacter famidurans]|nr:protein kinase [Aridibacter famidurans]
MNKCPRCDAAIRDNQEFCLSCGWNSADDTAETRRRPASPSSEDTPTRIRSGETDPPPVTDGSGAFISGTVIADRYRIVGLLGKGGMGEVYRADDLKLEQTVALKFLPRHVENNAEALRRFIGEVKAARKVSHQNVCRVFDIGEVDAKHFISMEFIDGDDLSVLLKRIGRFPSERAVEISRQICFGLHAIHAEGLIHRDLKPANVIIDSSGRPRITDFGIAGFEDELSGAELRVGTPAYMAPEQVAGKEVTKRSDVFSLGLLLYEIFTGIQAFDADSPQELLEKRKASRPTNPSQLIDNLDPLVEKTIQRCLEEDPLERPESAAQVALALPGGDPLEAAMVARETPSPEMVAASSGRGTLKPPAAIGLLAIFVGLFLGVLLLDGDYKGANLEPLDVEPDALAEKARQILEISGFDTASGYDSRLFDVDTSYLQYTAFGTPEKGLPPRLELLRTGFTSTIHFVYRHSAEPIAPKGSTLVTETDPPIGPSTAADLILDSKGRLHSLTIVPNSDRTALDGAEFDWTPLIERAGLDAAELTETQPQWTPPVFADRRIAWTGTLPRYPEIDVRVEAAIASGVPVYFKVVYPWTTQAGKADSTEDRFTRTGVIFAIVIIVAAVLVSVFLAGRNLSYGRGDLRGAFRLSLFMFLAGLTSELLFADHVLATFGELKVLYFAVSYSLIIAVIVGLLYVALEPLVRRSWPETLISWSRLISGDLRNPMVGRDIVCGGVFGLLHAFGIHFGLLLVRLDSDKYQAVGLNSNMLMLDGTKNLIAGILESLTISVWPSLLLLFIALLFFLVTRKRSLGLAVVWSLVFALQVVFFILSAHWLLLVSALINSTCLVLALRINGLLGLISYFLFFRIIWTFPLTLQSEKIQFSNSLVAMALTFGIVAAAAYFSIGRQASAGSVLLEGKKI